MTDIFIELLITRLVWFMLAHMTSPFRTICNGKCSNRWMSQLLSDNVSCLEGWFFACHLCYSGNFFSIVNAVSKMAHIRMVALLSISHNKLLFVRLKQLTNPNHTHCLVNI